MAIELISAKTLYMAGITNIIFILLTFFSCRCMTGHRFFNSLSKHKWYRVFYSHHCLYWWLFYISVIVHTVLAFVLFGSPL